ncbi:hypothetical protein [Helicobacter hepaticus]|jgi:hypothetical protein|uniref:Ancestral polypeptide n=1 Tax=Helicobacter hepaticus (strain ATCC 51449 / 3B1) TaxID=235279 RepID=Q7VHL9_HELHP|nr:hypothetical protein [Helicobacter hepaticus]AAP77544.1 conserved hypothetical protein [Helicobacter hepaticus ATCC 51449]
MPLPLIPILLGGAALATAGYGVKKAIDAYDDSQTAELYHERAKKKFNQSQARLDSKSAKVQKRFESLGQLQEQIVTDELERYADIVDKLKLKDNADLQDIVGKETLDGVANIQQSIVSLETTLGGLTGGALAGALTGFGMYGGVGLLASASTGTAIASLSGVAATNATMAWLGGGSLAAGGLGMAGGTMVLGGIVAAPVIAVMGSVFAAKAEEKKYDAYAYYDSVVAVCETMEAQGLVWEQLSKRAKEKRSTLKESRVVFDASLEKIEDIMENKGVTDIKNSWNDDEHRELMTLMQLAEVIVAVINAPIMNDEDRLTQELIEHQKKCEKLMKEIQKKWGQGMEEYSEKHEDLMKSFGGKKEYSENDRSIDDGTCFSFGIPQGR